MNTSTRDDSALRACWARGEAAVNGWLSIGCGYSAEIVASLGFDCVTIDMQHGMFGFDRAFDVLQAVSTYAVSPIVRVSGNEPTEIMHALDAGAEGIICPLVNTTAECERFVAACRYPPEGERSWGPGRGHLLGGSDYTERANGSVVTLAMVETRQSLANLDGIVAVEGLSGVFIGPNDLGLSFGHPPASESTHAEVEEAIESIRMRTQARGLKAGIFCSTGAAAKRRIEQGFDMVTPGDEAGAMRRAVAAEVAAARG